MKENDFGLAVKSQLAKWNAIFIYHPYINGESESTI